MRRSVLTVKVRSIFESMYLCTFWGWPVHQPVSSVAVAPSLVCHWSVGLGHACPERDLRAVCSVQQRAACRVVAQGVRVCACQKTQLQPYCTVSATATDNPSSMSSGLHHAPSKPDKLNG